VWTSTTTWYLVCSEYIGWDHRGGIGSEYRIFEDLVQGVFAECLRTQEQLLLQLTSTNESTRSSNRGTLTQKKFLKEDPWPKRSSKLRCSKAPSSFGEAFLSAVCNNAALCSAQEAKATGGKERDEPGDSAPAPPSLRQDYSSSVSWKLSAAGMQQQ
jgi:hypothetical protein